MALGLLHRSIDRVAIWTEDRKRRTPEAARLAPPDPLDCYGPLPPLPANAPSSGRWTHASPRPLREGDTLVVHATPARAPRLGTAILVPPWKIPRLGLVRGYVDLLAGAGRDVWLLCPPRHLERTPAGDRSGEGFVSMDLFRLRTTFEQLVIEIRWLSALAARRGPVGVVGLSLGALGAALAATAPERIDFAALVAPPELGRVLAETGIGRRYRTLCVRAGAPWPEEAAFEAALAPFDPARRHPTARRLFVAAALHDGVVPPSAPIRLTRAWGVDPALYPRGHMTLLFACSALRRDLGRFIAG